MKHLNKNENKSEMISKPFQHQVNKVLIIIIIEIS